MTKLDYGRIEDLEELTKAFKEARTPGEKEYYKEIMYRILNENDDIRYWREELIKATRTDSHDRVKYIIAKIHKIRQDQTNGISWGNNKGERNVN